MADCNNKSTINASAFASSSTISKKYVQQENTHQFEEIGGALDGSRKKKVQVDVDVREVYFLIMHFLSESPCQRTYIQLKEELLEHKLLPRRYHAWYSRTGGSSGDSDDDGISLTLSNSELLERFSFIKKDHLVKLLEELLSKSSAAISEGCDARSPTAADASTLLGLDSVSLIHSEQTKTKEHVCQWVLQLRWPHRRADQVHALAFRELGGGYARHHRAPSVRASSYAIAKPSVLADRIQIIKTLRGHRNAVYCAIFDKTGEYIITGSDDRLVKIWSTTTGFCLRSCRGHDGDITDLAVSSSNNLVASASNDCIIRVWRFPDGAPVSVLRGHTSAVTAIAFSPRPGCEHHLLSSSDDGTCRIWDARDSLVNARTYSPKLETAQSGPKLSASVQPNPQCRSQILCCGFNASGTIFATGSADKLARVWDACKWSVEPSGEPNHELGVLRGHEDDVNYVQFSGCAATARAIIMDAAKEERLSKYRNSWPHESIVTCSRDGTAIIWIPRPRKFHGKSRWIKSYHLRVPPPPMLPQPPRGGGPRQRLLPTPRGVNMIVWSLDNSFVLAAIMDCRICVWNAVDGSLVHSLTGHTKSTFVLDVHPYDPRIAMSAGYDGRVIIWDIWEGHPIKVYETGEFNLVDGKFSPDGTSIVISDEVGQIYLLATGQGESQKDAKYDQFFLGDYRPLTRDVHGYVIDQETQLCPHIRNLQDLLCDANMIPYPEPYQSLYQHRRLGTLGMNWRPPPVHMVVGAMADAMYIDQHNILLGPGGQSPGRQGRTRWVEQPFETDDAMEWEQETGDDSGSDYSASIDDASEEDEREESQNFSDDFMESSEEEESSLDEDNRRLHLRRSERNKQKRKAKIFTSSGRLVKRKFIDDGYDSPVTRSKQRKKQKHLRQGSSSRRESDNEFPRRPKRLAARNARLIFSQIGDSEDDENSSDWQKQQTPSSEHVCTDEQQQSTGNSGQKEPDKDNRIDDLAMNAELSDVGDSIEKPSNLIVKLPVPSKRCHNDEAPVSNKPVLPHFTTNHLLSKSEGVEEMNDAVQQTASNGSGAGFASSFDKDGAEIGSKRREMDKTYAGEEDDDESSKDLTEFQHEVKRSWELKVEDAKPPQIVAVTQDSCTLTNNTIDIAGAMLGNSKYTGCQIDAFESDTRPSSGPFVENGVKECEEKADSDTIISAGLSCGEKRSNDSIPGNGLCSLVEATCSSLSETLEHRDASEDVINLNEEMHFSQQVSQKAIVSELAAHTGAVTVVDSGHPAAEIVGGPTKAMAIAGRDYGEPGETRVAPTNQGEEYQTSGFKEQDESGALDDQESAPFEASDNFKNCQVEVRTYPPVKLNSIHENTGSVMSMHQMESKEGVNNDLNQMESIMQEKGLAHDNVYISNGLNEIVHEESSNFPHDARNLLEAYAHSSTSAEERKDATCDEAAVFVGNNYTPAEEKAPLEDKTCVLAEDGTVEDSMKITESSTNCKNSQETGFRGKRTNLLRTTPRIYHRACRYGPSGMTTMEKQNVTEQYQENGDISTSPTGKNSNQRMRITRQSKIRTSMLLRQDKTEEWTSELMNSGELDRNGQAEAIDDRINDCNSAPELEVKEPRFSLRSRNNCIFRRYPSLEKDEGSVLESLGGWKAKGGRSKRRVSWLLLTEVEEGARYIPQAGDEVAYVMQGHEEFLNSRHLEDKGPWKTVKVRLKAVEICRVVGLEYCSLQGFGNTCCRLTLKLIDEESKAYGRSFKLLLPELTDFSDFVIEKARYDTAIKRNWTKRDKCKVWWRSEDGKGGQWWYGRVVGIDAKSSEYPDSPWDRCTVQYTGDSSGLHRHSPWELFEPNSTEAESSHIDECHKSELLSVIEKLEEHCKNHEDEYGLRKLRQLVNRSDFLHKTPVPLSLEMIKARLSNNYYRSFEAFKHDVWLLVSNAGNFSGDESELATKMQKLANTLLEV